MSDKQSATDFITKFLRESADNGFVDMQCNIPATMGDETVTVNIRMSIQDITSDSTGKSVFAPPIERFDSSTVH